MKLLRSIDDRRNEAFVLTRIAEIYYDLRDLSRYNDCYRQAPTIYRAAGDRGGERRALERLRYYHTDRIEYSREFLEVIAGESDFISETGAHRRTAETYAEMQTTEATTRALESYNAALAAQNALSAQLSSEPNAKPDSPLVSYSRRDTAAFMLKIGETQNRLGQTAAARGNFRRTLATAREIKDSVPEYGALKMFEQIESARTKRSEK